MPTINIAIGQTKYQVNCSDGEEDKIEDLASRLNERVNNLARAIKGADEKTLMMLCGIMMEEELQNAKEGIIQTNVIDVDSDSDDVNKISEEDLQDAIAENMENMAIVIEKLANKIRAY